MKKISVTVSCLILLLLFSCSESSKPKKFKPVSEADGKAFALNVEEQFKNGKNDLLDPKMDFESMVDRGLEGISLTAQQKKACLRSLPDYFFLGEEIETDLEDGGSFTFLATRIENGECLAIFRKVNAESGVDYLEFLLGKPESTDTIIKIRDIYSFIVGDFLSKKSAEEMLAFDPEINRLQISPRQKDPDFKKGTESLKEMDVFIELEDFEGAREVWDSMPENFKKEKLAQRYKLNIAIARGDRNYEKALDEFEKTFPDDPAVDLLMVDKAFLRKDTASLAQYIKNIKSRLKMSDPHLDMMLANGYFDLDDCEKAMPLSLGCVAADSTLEDPYWILFRCNARNGNFKIAADYFRILHNRFEVGLDYIDDPDGFEDLVKFLKSNEFRTLQL